MIIELTCWCRSPVETELQKLEDSIVRYSIPRILSDFEDSAGGLYRGDSVRSRIEHKNVTKGDIGTVLGPCESADADKADRILVDFGGEKGKVNILKTEVDRNNNHNLGKRSKKPSYTRFLPASLAQK